MLVWSSPGRASWWLPLSNSQGSSPLSNWRITAGLGSGCPVHSERYQIGQRLENLGLDPERHPRFNTIPGHGAFWRTGKVRLQKQQDVHFIKSTSQIPPPPAKRRNIKTLFYAPEIWGPWAQAQTLIHASASSCLLVNEEPKPLQVVHLQKTKVGLTQGNQVPIVLQHHVSVHKLLCSVQELPFLPGEVHKYILEGHQCLQHKTRLNWASCVSVLPFLNPDREHWGRERRWTRIYLGVSSIGFGF